MYTNKSLGSNNTNANLNNNNNNNFGTNSDINSNSDSSSTNYSSTEKKEKSSIFNKAKNFFASLTSNQTEKQPKTPPNISSSNAQLTNSVPENQFVDDSNSPNIAHLPKGPSSPNSAGNKKAAPKNSAPKNLIPLPKGARSVPGKKQNATNSTSNLSNAKFPSTIIRSNSNISKPEGIYPKSATNPVTPVIIGQDKSSNAINAIQIIIGQDKLSNAINAIQNDNFVEKLKVESSEDSLLKGDESLELNVIKLDQDVLKAYAAALVEAVPASIVKKVADVKLSDLEYELADSREEDKLSDSEYESVDNDEDDKFNTLQNQNTIKHNHDQTINSNTNISNDMNSLSVQAVEIDSGNAAVDTDMTKNVIGTSEQTAKGVIDEAKEIEPKKLKPRLKAVPPQIPFAFGDEETNRLKSFLTQDKILILLKSSTIKSKADVSAIGIVDNETLESLKKIDFTPDEIQSLLAMGLTSLVAKKLLDPKLKLSTDDSSTCIETCINMGKHVTDRAIGEDLVFIIGNTGAGKSTAINYLLGCEMERTGEKKRFIGVKATSKIKEQMPIGHSQSKSKTFIPSISTLRLGNMLICDAPGFTDTRGVEINISNAINIKNTLKNAKSVRVILLINAHAASSDRGDGIKRIKNTLQQLFGTDDIKQYAKSIIIGLSHVPIYDTYGDALTLESLKDDFYIEEAGLPTELRSNTLILDPLESEQRKNEGIFRQDWMTKIESLDPLKDHQSIFQTVLANDDILMLINLSKQLSIKIKEAFAQQDYVKAAYNLAQMKYLQIIERKEVDELFQQNLQDVLSEIKSLHEEINQCSSIYNFDRADSFMSKFIEIVSLFSDFDNNLQEQLLATLAEVNNKRIEAEEKLVGTVIDELQNYFYEHCTSDETLVEILDNSFNHVEIPVTAKESPLYLGGYLKLLSQHEGIKTYAENVFNALARLFIISTELSKAEKLTQKAAECIEIFKNIATKAAELSFKIKNEKLIALKSEILVDLETLKNKINYKVNGLEIYPLMKTITEYANAESTLKNLQALGEINSIHQEIESLHKRANAAQEIISLLAETKELAAWHQFIHERLIHIKHELQVNDIITTILDTLNDTGKWETLPELADSVLSFTPAQIKTLKEDNSINAVAQTKFQQILDEFDQVLDWDKHGKTVLSIAEKYNVAMTLNNGSELFVPLISDDDEKLNLCIHNIVTLIALISLPDNYIPFTSQSFLDIFHQTFGKILKRFADMAERIEKEELQRKVDGLISIINNESLPQNDFNRLKSAIDVILRIDPKKLRLVALKGKVDSCIEDFHSGLTKRDYDTVVTSVTVLNKLNETLGIDILEHEEINAVFNMPLYYKTINQHIGELEAKVVSNILNAFKLEKLAKTPFNYDKLQENQDFFNALEMFNALIDVTVWKKSIYKTLAGNVNLIYMPLTTIDDTEIICRFLVQLQILTAQIGPRISELTAAIMNLTAQYLDKLEAGLTYRIGVALQGISLGEDELGRYGSEIINLFPHFKRAAREAFTKKTSHRTAEILLSEMTTIKTDRLNKFYGVFAKEYDKLLGNIIDNHTSEIETKNFITRQESIDNAIKIAKKLKHATNFSSDSDKISLLLANIFAVWSHLDAHNGEKFEKSKMVLLRPHPSQILSIFLMLGMDISQAMENYLIEVKTGEGKSVISAGFSIAFALMGYQVDVACYNPYLAERDNKAFRELFNQFNVSGMVSYSNFSDLTYKYLNAHYGDVNNSLYEFMKGNLVDSAPPKENKEKSVLFIDEVDVFFSKNFLGVTYGRCSLLTSNYYVQFLENLWNERDKYKNLDVDSFIQQVSSNALLNNFYQEYPGIKPFMPYYLKKLRGALISVANNWHNYIIHNSQIGYVDTLANTITTDSFDGHLTAFAAIKEKEKITPSDLSRKASLSFSYGRYSYVEIPKDYKFIVGVTGTLTTLSDYEIKLLNDEYNIKRRTLIPSVFDKKPLQGADKASVYGGNIDEFKQGNGYFYNIRKEIDDCIKLDRAVLVVFETEERLNLFKEFIALHPYEANSVRQNILTFNTNNVTRDLIISEAATRGRVTLMTKQFGRGSDFVCHDSQIRKSGGVAVICTFFPETISEEIQIKGRTCRQDDPGSFQLIVYLDDLKEKFSVYTMDELGITPNSIYQKLCDKRKEKNLKADQDMGNNVTNAKEQHDKSVKLAKLFAKQSIFTSKESRKNQITELLLENCKLN